MGCWEKSRKPPRHNSMPCDNQNEIPTNHPLLGLQVAEQNHGKTILGKGRRLSFSIRLLLLVLLIKFQEVNLNK
jgi:hypothetical protein